MKKIPPIYCLPIATGNFKDKKTEYQCSACGRKWWSPNPPERNLLHCQKRIEEYALQFSKLSIIEMIYYSFLNIKKKFKLYFLMYNPMALLRMYSRTNICKTCPFYYAKKSRCRLCGCHMKTQSRDINWKCPLGKWNGESEPKPIKELLEKYNINVSLKDLKPENLEIFKSNTEFEDELRSGIYKYIHNGTNPPKTKSCSKCKKVKENVN